LQDDFGNGIHELIAPDVFAIEIGHALTRAERQKRISVGYSKVLLADILRTAPRFYSSLPLLADACDISSKMRVGIYDCLYVVLAAQEGCEFITADDRLVKNLQAVYPFITPLTSLP